MSASIADLGTPRARAKRRAKVRRELAARPRRLAADVAPAYITLPRPASEAAIFAPCAHPGCGRLSRPFEVKPPIKAFGVVLARGNVRARCDEHAGWLDGDEPVAAPKLRVVEMAAAAAHAEAVPAARGTHPAVIAAAVILIVAVCGFVLQAAHDQRVERFTLEAQ